MNALGPINTDDEVRRMTAWIERLRKVRIFRPLRVSAEVNGWGDATVQATIEDGLVTIATTPFSFHLPATKWSTFYERLEDELVAAFRAHVRKLTAPESVLAGVTPVKVTDAATDGEEIVYKF